jgi:Cysteine rich repeat
MIATKLQSILVAAAVLAAETIFLSNANAQGAGVRQACRSDYEQFCNGVQPGGGRILACLKSHAGDLSPVCQQALAKAAGGMPKTREDGEDYPRQSDPDHHTFHI